MRKKKYNKKYGKIGLSYKISDSSRYHYEDENVEMTFTKVEQRNDYVLLLYMNCRNKTDIAQIPERLGKRLWHIQYDPEREEDTVVATYYQYKLSPLSSRDTVEPGSYLVKPGETVQSYIPVALDYPGIPLKIGTVEEVLPRNGSPIKGDIISFDTKGMYKE